MDPIADVTEVEWLTSSSAWRLLSHVRDRLSARKQVLLAAARWASAFEVAVRFVDGKATADELDAVAATLDPERAANVGFSALNEGTHAADVCRLWNVLRIARGEASLLDPQMQGGGEVDMLPFNPGWMDSVFYVREVFGNPFRPFEPDATLLACYGLWRNGRIPALAQRIYDECDFDQMPELGAALSSAGCTRWDILEHCYQQRTHVRGCFVIDALLGKF